MSEHGIFVSHSSQDSQFCREYVTSLQRSGVDVWYDEQDLRGGQLSDNIGHELIERPVFIVILSKSALNSDWVRQEFSVAHMLYTKHPDNRVILPVTAQQTEDSDYHNMWAFLLPFRRIEGPGGAPLDISAAISRTLHDLALDTRPASDSRREHNPRTHQPKTLLWVDDIPSNNYYPKRILEKLGVVVTVSTSTDDALGKLFQHEYSAIISDMSRPEGALAGYTLLEQAQKMGKRAPFILYAGSQLPEHVAEAKRKGAFGQTSMPDELIELVRQALNIS